MAADGSALPLSLEERIDQVCDRFEAAWRAGQRPRIEGYVAEFPEAERPLLLADLLKLEMGLRAADGETLSPAAYLARFAEHGELIEGAFAALEQAPACLEQHEVAASVLIGAGSTGDDTIDPAGERPRPIPERIGPRYQVLRKLGGGTYGDVYLAQDQVLNRPVAVKVPSTRLMATLRAQEEFLREARIVAGLQHEGIVRAFDFGVAEDGLCYIVYEYVGGTTLAESLKQRPLSWDEAARLVAHVAAALHYAHLKGLVHRDLKPANILLDQAGRPRIADFGLAVREEELPKQRGLLAGTLPYMSPEQVRREAHFIDGRSDIYSLGVVFYELLCERRPFEAEMVDDLKDQILHRDAKPLRQIKGSIPRELERICLKALSKRVSDRYATAEDMAEELWAVISPGRPPPETSPRGALGEPPAGANKPLAVQGSFRALIEIASGPGQGRVYELLKDRVLIGSSESCDIHIPSFAASRYHAQLIRTDSGYSLEDLRSRNGSYVNGHLVTGRMSLRSGDHIHTAAVILLYQLVTEHAPAESAQTAVAPDNLEDSSKQITAEKTPLVDENVQFSVFRPNTIRPEKWYPLLAFAHLAELPIDAPAGTADPVDEMHRQAQHLLREKFEEYRERRQDSRQPVTRESDLTFVPEVPGIEFNPPSQTFIWTEMVHREEFRLRAGAALEGQTARGRLTVFLGSIILADIPLTFRVSSGDDSAKDSKNQVVERARPYRRIFASYARRDSWIVEQFRQYARALGDEYLRKHVRLRVEEQWSEHLERLMREADVFQLFWSSNSMHSPFVRREWEYALSLQRPHFVRPVYWEEPLPASAEKDLPPQELRKLGFQRIPVELVEQAASPLESRREKEDAQKKDKRETLPGQDPASLESSPMPDDSREIDGPNYAGTAEYASPEDEDFDEDFDDLDEDEDFDDLDEDEDFDDLDEELARGRQSPPPLKVDDKQRKRTAWRFVVLATVVIGALIIGALTLLHFW
jgi:serine/threonine protein kinase